MYLNFSTYLDEFIPFISEDLISSQSLRSLEAFANSLPPMMSGVLECRLKQSNCNVDYQICIDPYTNLCVSGIDDDFYLYLQSFYKSWKQRDSMIGSYVENMWLEFDAVNTNSYNNLPCIFSHLHKDFRYNPAPIAQAFLTHFKYFSEKPLLVCLDHFSELLPPNLRFVYLGYLFPRLNPALRVGVYSESLGELIDYLKKIGWQSKNPSYHDDLSRLLFPVTKYLNYFMISLDFNAVIFPRIGLECYLSPNPYDYLDWEPVLDYLVSSSLCSPQKKKALLKWHQPSKGDKVFSQNSNNLFSQGLQNYFSVSSTCKHAINHIKLVYEPSLPLEAKAYLGFTCQ